MSNSTTGDVSVAGHSSSDVTWSENTLTWNNRPIVSTTVLDTQNVSGINAFQYAFDVSDYVAQQKAAGATHVTFVIKGTGATSPFAIFASDETSLAGKHPLLTVVEEAVANNPPTVGTPSASLNGAQTQANLSVTASDDGQTQPLSYNWVTVSKPSGSSVSFASGTSASTTATLDRAGPYTFRVDVHRRAGTNPLRGDEPFARERTRLRRASPVATFPMPLRGWKTAVSFKRLSLST